MVLLVMFFLHIIDDFFIQGMCLSQLKQRVWWTKQPEYKELYKYDYIMALFIHSFSWTFMVMLPIAYCLDWKISFYFILIFMTTMIEHCVIDHLKANKGLINLVTDQMLHIVQIVLIFVIYKGGWM